MIPDFKTFINESIWGDINRRSQGNQVKKEDDINLMERDAFFDYLNAHYEPNFSYNKIRQYEELDCILVPLFGTSNAPRNVSIELDYSNETKITMSLRMLENVPDIYEALKNEFHITEMPYSSYRGAHIRIYPKQEGESAVIKNSFFLKVIDFLLNEAEGKYRILLSKK